MSKLATVLFAALLATGSLIATTDLASAQKGAHGFHNGGGGPPQGGAPSGGAPSGGSFHASGGSFRSGGNFSGGAPRFSGAPRVGFSRPAATAVTPRFQGAVRVQSQPRFSSGSRFASTRLIGRSSRYAFPRRAYAPRFYHRRFHRRFYGLRYIAPVYPVYRSCYRWRRVWTIYGPRLRRVNICRPHIRIHFRRLHRHRYYY